MVRTGVWVTVIATVLTGLWQFFIGDPCLPTVAANRYAHAQWVAAEEARPPRKWNEMILEKPFEYAVCRYQPTVSSRAIRLSTLALLMLGIGFAATRARPAVAAASGLGAAFVVEAIVRWEMAVLAGWIDWMQLLKWVAVLFAGVAGAVAAALLGAWLAMRWKHAA